MSRALIIIRSKEDRERAARWCIKAPSGCRITFKETKRSLPQNDLMWSLLTDVAKQREHFGRKYSADIWKLIMMNAWGRETRFVPSMDGTTVVPIGQSSSDLSKDEMSELIEFIMAWGVQNGISFHNGRENVAA